MMKRIDLSPCSREALVLIDLQRGFLDTSYWGPRNNPQLEVNCKTLLDFFRENNLEVIHVQHLSLESESPLRPGQRGVEFLSDFEPKNGERLFQKNVNSAFVGTGLDNYLKQGGFTHLTLVGLTSEHCVSTSARMGANLGYRIHMTWDSTATFDRPFRGKKIPVDQVHEVHLGSLNGEFAQIAETVYDLKDIIASRCKS